MAVSCAEPGPLTPGAATIPAALPGQWDSTCCCCRIWPGPASPSHMRGCEQPKWDTCTHGMPPPELPHNSRLLLWVRRHGDPC